METGLGCAWDFPPTEEHAALPGGVRGRLLPDQVEYARPRSIWEAALWDPNRATQASPLLNIRNHKILAVLLPLQQHALPQRRKVLHHTLARGSPQKLFLGPFPHRRHPHGGLP